MIKKIAIIDNVIKRIQTNIRQCPGGKLKGFLDREAGVVNVLQALPLGVGDINRYQKVGTWGINLKQAPAFPKPDEIFINFDPVSTRLKTYQVLSQGLKEIADAEIIRVSTDPFQRVQGLLDTKILFQKKVVIVGLGSVGSLVALELAKSSVGRFLLYDPDTLAVSNVCRHVGDLRDMGKYKTTIIAERIYGRNPQAQVEMFEKNILQIDEDELKHDWGEADLIIASTDSQQATLLLNQLSLDLNIPILWIGLYERASKGHIIYSIPGATPCLACVLPSLAEIENLTPKEDRVIDYSSVKDITQIKAEPGLGTDIGFVSMVGAKIALALLLRNDPTSALKEILPHGKTLLIIANTAGSIFPETKAFQTAWVETAVNNDCEWCQRDRQYQERYGKGQAQLQSAVQGIVDGLPSFKEGEEGL